MAQYKWEVKVRNVRAYQTGKSVVVGIDGSRVAVAAAQWGADEALSHGVPLRLLYVVDRNRAFTPSVVKAQFSVAEAALQDARAAVEATREAVTIQLETMDGDPGTVLNEVSRLAALLCVGSPKAAPHGPSDSLAANLAASAHCSVAIIPAALQSAAPGDGWIAALLDFSTSDYDVLQHAMEEAQLREFSLRVVTMRRGPADVRDNRADASVSQPEAALEERLVNWARRYRGIDPRIVQTDDFFRYVEEHQQSIRSVVLSAEHHHPVAHLVELTRARTLHDANFSVFVIRGQHL